MAAQTTTDLKIEMEAAERWNRRLSITVPADRVQRVRTSVAAQIGRTARLPGFRKGKLPPKIIEQRFGRSIDQETLDRTIQDAYREALSAEGLAPITQGQIDNVEYQAGEPLRFDVQFEVQPIIELARTNGFSAVRPKIEVGDDEVDAVIERLRDERAGWEAIDADTTPDFGDEVLVEITAGTGDDAEDPRQYRFELGEGQAIPDVEEAIRTLSVGGEGEFDVRFPYDFQDEARQGAEEHMRIRLLDATRKVLPDLDAEFARGVGEVEDIAAVRDRIMEDLQQDAKQRSESDVRGQLLERILEANAFEVPASMEERYLDHVFQPNRGRGGGGNELENLSPEDEQRFAEVRDQLRPQAQQALRRMLVVERLAEQEGLRATQDEIDERIDALAGRHGNSPSEVYIQLEKTGQLEALEREITEDKVFAHLASQNQIVDAE